MKLKLSKYFLFKTYKPLVLLKLKSYKIYATKIIKLFSVQNIISKKNFHKELFLLETLIAKRIIIK